MPVGDQVPTLAEQPRCEIYNGWGSLPVGVQVPTKECWILVRVCEAAPNITHLETSRWEASLTHPWGRRRGSL